MRRMLLVLGMTLAMCGSVRAQTLRVAAVTSHSVTLTWTASVTVGATYNMYRGLSAGGPFAVVGTTPTSVLTYVDGTVIAGSSYVYQLTAACANQCGANIIANSESAPSNQFAVTIPNPAPPGAPTGLSGTVAVVHIGTQDRITATWMDAPGVPTFYVLFNKTMGFIQMNGAPAVNAQGSYSISYTGAPFNGNFAICDYNNTCMILPFVG